MKRTLILFFTLLFLLPVGAQIRGSNITVSIQPDHRDWNYTAGEKAVFHISVLKSGTTLPNAKVDLEAGPVMYPDVKKSLTLKEGETQWTGSMSQPGFYRVKVTAHVDGKDYEGLCTAGFNPGQLRPATQEPKDFDGFWKSALDEARKIPLDSKRILLAERCTDEVNVYEVNFQNDAYGSRIYGILCVPTKPGKYPALLRVPGAGVRPYQGDSWTASKGCITLEIGIHGIPVTMEQKVYDNLLAGALNNYWNCNLDDAQNNYYRRVVVGCVRHRQQPGRFSIALHGSPRPACDIYRRSPRRPLRPRVRTERRSRWLAPLFLQGEERRPQAHRGGTLLRRCQLRPPREVRQLVQLWL